MSAVGMRTRSRPSHLFPVITPLRSRRAPSRPRLIMDLQDGAVDEIEDVEAAVRLVLWGIHAAGCVVANKQQEITISSVIDFEELED